ncbi:Hypothetical predicted protein [Octopus vulgaris]|uniref:Uncharacterized protein n=2 Tax=Octopus TaxID=6643 RepID=A0AA36B0F3_OCTVU|nr:uncharacterized protein LOC115214189 [Octopus sinensis]CAI9725334.1 Hypothetical predicted protein [Octopus vulgaris]
MSRLYQSVKACIYKESPEAVDTRSNTNSETNIQGTNANKKTDVETDPSKQPSMIWRVSSGLYSTATGAATGAVSLGVGSVKWVAGKGYDVGHAVVTKVPIPGVSRWKTKDKSE